MTKQHVFERATSAKFLCREQNFMAIIILAHGWLQIEISVEFELWRRNVGTLHTLIKYVHGLFQDMSKINFTGDGLLPATWASCQIRKIAGAHAQGMPGTFFPSPQVSDPDMHHGTCVTHVPWCMPGSLTSGFLWHRRRGNTFPAFPAHAQHATLRIW